ncbi:helix-turn-helix transcriptional regulator [Acidovorax sp. sic0104]|uniref:helix-turn-helix domain-containing protein n=1 Tax=Acidovorax sp. sic0104 TaxID=2854784 RepID=UPI001C43E722|nr:helix-turn-helix transcriptional regulator [Acidovorax sp. sic0104]MBV7542067.1 helix-turn-helix transcriptional regulator [Acidovorax sp. sic0104]
MKSPIEFSRTLTTAKEQRGVTQKEIAERTGLSPLAVSQMLDGKVSPRLSNAMAVADALGLEMVLMPKGAAESFENSNRAPERTVRSALEQRLSTMQRNAADGKNKESKE